MPSLVKLPQWLWIKDVWKSSTLFTTSPLFPLVKGFNPSFKQIIIGCVLNSKETGQWFRKRRLFIDVLNVFPLCRFCLSLKKDLPLHMTKFESPLPQDTLCQFKFVLYSVWLWRFFKKSLYRQYLPLGRGY